MPYNTNFPYTSAVQHIPAASPATMAGQSCVDASGNYYIYDGYRWINQGKGYGYGSYNNLYDYQNNYYNYTIPSSITMSFNEVSDNDIKILYKDGTTVDVGATLNIIKKHLGMIEPDINLIEKYPAVKAAYEEYTYQFNNVLETLFPNLKSAIDSYNTVVEIVKLEESNGNNI